MTSDDDLADELRELLHAAGVKPSVLLNDREATARGVHHLRAILDRGGTHTRRRVLAAGVAVAAASAAIAFGIVTGTVTPSPPAAAGTPPLLTFSAADGRGPDEWQGEPARARFLEMAEAARQLPRLGPGPVQHVVLDAWWSTNQHTDDDTVASELIPQQLEQWRSPDGTVRQINRLGPPLTPNGKLDSAIEWEKEPVQSDDTFPGADPPWGDTIPTDPQQLRRVLTQGDEPACGPNTGGCLLRDAIDMHYNYVVPPEALAALWLTLSDEPAIRYLGTTTDRLGRDAIAFTAPSPDGVGRLIILANPTTGAWLGDETVLVEPSPAYDFSPPAVTAFTALVIADHVEAPGLASAR